MPFDGTDTICIRLQQFTPSEAGCGLIWICWINGNAVGAKHLELMRGPKSRRFVKRVRDQLGINLRTVTYSAWLDAVCVAFRTAKPCPLWVLLAIGAETDEDYDLVIEMTDNGKT